jgi:hypothetical protein
MLEGNVTWSYTMSKRRWTRARRAKHKATMQAKKEGGLPKTQAPVIFQLHQGKLRMLKLQTIQAYIPIDHE